MIVDKQKLLFKRICIALHDYNRVQIEAALKQLEKQKPGIISLDTQHGRPSWVLLEHLEKILKN